jgi:DNA-binding HxlR family transcriptional regulator
MAAAGSAQYTAGMTDRQTKCERTMNDVHGGATCAVAATAELIASKWTPLIVHDLSEGPRRFMQLEHACPGISPRTLSERLQMLEGEGIVIRRSYPESPPRVEYELTEKGLALLPIIDAMRQFGHAWLITGTARTRRRAETR